MDAIRVFIRWLGTIDGVDPGPHIKVRSPNFPKGEHARGAMIDSETAEVLLAYLEKYEYASRAASRSDQNTSRPAYRAGG